MGGWGENFAQGPQKQRQRPCMGEFKNPYFPDLTGLKYLFLINILIFNRKLIALNVNMFLFFPSILLIGWESKEEAGDSSLYQQLKPPGQTC